MFASGRWVLDYLTLLARSTAVGAEPRPSIVLLAFCAIQLLGTLPLTPGGLGFVEAGLTGTLALAGVSAGAAVVATLAYRLVSFWLPIPAGGGGRGRPPPPLWPGAGTGSGLRWGGLRRGLRGRPGRTLGGRILGRTVLLPPGVDRRHGGSHDQVLLEVLGVVHVG